MLSAPAMIPPRAHYLLLVIRFIPTTWAGLGEYHAVPSSAFIDSRLPLKWVISWRTRHKYFTDKMVRTKGFHEGTDIYYQKMQLAPKNHLILGCVESKMTVFQQRLAHFCSLVEDKELFLDNIQGHFATARKLLEKEPCLVKDFQVMLDASGQVYHLDFDRCFSSSGSKWHMSSDFTETCFQSLDGMEHSLEKALLNDTNNKLRD
jgi:hypothetical protein